MMPALSPNTQAILLLTAPLIAGRGTSTPDLLTPGEYKRLARHLRTIQSQPADLISPDAGELLRACQPVIDQSRLQRLLGRGFLLSQVIERWGTRAIWVVSRADAGYPRRLKGRLREDAPAVLYGCGQISLLDTGGLAVVGSRHVDDALINYTTSVGHLAARAGRMLISGGAKGIDLAAMRGALEAGGKVCGVLADNLEKASLNREHRNLLIEGQLTLISPYDPSVGFNVGHAMQRNKLIYALADASLVVSSDVDKGGTWAGAIEQLQKLRFVPVYVRSTGEESAGLDALRKKGALAWPNPEDTESFEAVFSSTSAESSIFTNDELFESQLAAPKSPEPAAASQDGPAVTAASEDEEEQQEILEEKPLVTPTVPAAPGMEATPADALFAAVRESIQRLLTTPKKDAEVAAALEVLTPQARAWLQRLVDEGVLEKQKKPPGYIIKRKRLFE
ncbi:DNA-processing protein DprA [Sinorhizobium meliloti]|uniref:DNA-processing protein DprA n=1 Tax=Rhizobium meliloti TaxID=382 RepID=UPI0012980348|nr:DNA-processing protein DprA [Sinorhizobium meliloti]MQV31033.1 DNA-processing protein DprA [Sinorhizobium meliloti]